MDWFHSAEIRLNIFHDLFIKMEFIIYRYTGRPKITTFSTTNSGTKYRFFGGPVDIKIFFHSKITIKIVK